MEQVVEQTTRISTKFYRLLAALLVLVTLAACDSVTSTPTPDTNVELSPTSYTSIQVGVYYFLPTWNNTTAKVRFDRAYQDQYGFTYMKANWWAANRSQVGNKSFVQFLAGDWPRWDTAYPFEVNVGSTVGPNPWSTMNSSKSRWWYWRICSRLQNGSSSCGASRIFTF